MYYHCIVFFDVQNLVLCLTRELIKFIDYKIMVKLKCKTICNSAFVGKQNHQNRTRVDFGIMFLKNVVLYETYSKELQWPNTFCTSLYLRISYINNDGCNYCDKNCLPVLSP